MNNPFDRTVINPREKPLSQDINQAGSQLDYAVRSLARELLAKRASSSSSSESPSAGFLSGGFLVAPQAIPNLTVTVKAGIGFVEVVGDTPSAIGGVNGLDDLTPYKPLVLMNDTVFTVPTPPGANSRVDIVEVRANRLATNPQQRLVLDPSTGAFNPSTVNKTLAFTVDGSVGTVLDPALSTAALSYKQGAVAASPVEPSVTPGYVKLARINVGTSVLSVGQADLVDRRPLLGPGGVINAAIRYRLLWNGGAPTITVDSVVAPPGIQLAAKGLTGARGGAQVFVVGGEILGLAYTAIVENPNTLTAANYIVGRTRPAAIAGGLYNDLVSAEQATLAGATPPITAGVGTKRIAVVLDALFVDGSTGIANQTDTSLEDLRFDARFALSY